MSLVQLDDYKYNVNNIAKTKKPLLFFNKNNGHVHTVLDTIISYSENEIQLVTNSLTNNELFDTKIIKSLTKFLYFNKIFRLHILSYNVLDYRTKIFDIFNNSDNITTKIIKDGRGFKSEKYFNTIDDKICFCLGDESMYQISSPKHNEQNFNNPEKVKNMRDIFYKVFYDENFIYNE